ncbi:YlqD family protein [Salsuginibacillus kocurii]|uniref:YlqD family protein n=1 Tax=Salsuginibacillus kocurii TaxID=427078 RepID=UPI00035C44D0|nr:YlqD family protein [Salsuginibacillus kocurii]
MKIKKRAIVKHILTPRYRDHLLSEIKKDRYQAQEEMEQLEFQLHKRMKEETDGSRRRFIKDKYEGEMSRRRERIEQASFKESRISALPEDAEIPRETVETYRNVQVGDVWAEISGEEEIIVKDGIVDSIRKRGRTEEDDDFI